LGPSERRGSNRDFSIAEAPRVRGFIRYIGFTGHKDPIRLRLKNSEDRVTLNVMDAHFRSFRHQVVPRLVKQEIGVLGMKAMGDRIILDSGAVSAVECLHYAMSLPTSVVITGIERISIRRSRPPGPSAL